MTVIKLGRHRRGLAVVLDEEIVREAGLREGHAVRAKVERGRVVLEPLPPGVRPEVMETIERIAREEEKLLERLAEYDANDDR